MPFKDSERKRQQAAAIIWRREQSCLAEKHTSSEGLSKPTDGAKQPSAKESVTAKQPKYRGPEIVWSRTEFLSIWNSYMGIFFTWSPLLG